MASRKKSGETCHVGMLTRLSSRTPERLNHERPVKVPDEHFASVCQLKNFFDCEPMHRVAFVRVYGTLEPFFSNELCRTGFQPILLNFHSYLPIIRWLWLGLESYFFSLMTLRRGRGLARTSMFRSSLTSWLWISCSAPIPK